MIDLKNIPTDKLFEELIGRDNVIVCYETEEKVGALVRGKASSIEIPYGYTIIAVKTQDTKEV